MTNHLLTEDEVKATGKRYHPPYSVLSEAYMFMLKGNLRGARLFHSDVYFVREALRKRSGFFFSLEEVEKAMKAEKWTERSYRRY